MDYLACLLVAVAFLAKDTSGDERRIIGGVHTYIQNYPYQVSLERTEGGHICGGAILTATHIVTSAHCVQSKGHGEVRVRVGSTLIGKDGTLHDVKHIQVHPDYSRSYFELDIAVLKLKQPIKLSINAQAIPLVPENKGPLDGEILTVTGWGANTFADSIKVTLSYGLKVVEIPLLNKKFCWKIYADKLNHILSSDVICAGGGGTGIGVGDAGGPLVNKRGKLVGVASWSESLVNFGYPGVFTNVADPRVRKFVLDKITQ